MNSSTEAAVKPPALAKFRFDQAFDALAHAAKGHGRPEIYTASDLAHARAEGRAEGHAEGRAEMAREIEHMLAQALSAIAAKIGSLEATQKRVLTAVNRDSVDLALTLARKVALGLTRLRPLEEIECLIADCLGKIELEPRIVIRINPDVVEPLSAKLDALARDAGFEGRIVLLGEPSLAPDSCQIDWADGGTERSSEAVAAAIEDTVERLLAVGLEPEALEEHGEDPSPAPEPND